MHDNQQKKKQHKYSTKKNEVKKEMAMFCDSPYQKLDTHFSVSLLGEQHPLVDLFIKIKFIVIIM